MQLSVLARTEHRLTEITIINERYPFGVTGNYLMKNERLKQVCDYDVAVVGGGIAGIAAALAAARQGAKTVLLEKEYALGGLATLGLIVIYLPLCDGAGTKMSAGICEELIKLSVGLSPVQLPEAWTNPNSTEEERTKQRYRVTYNAASFMILAEKLLIDNGVQILYDARMTEAVTENGKVKSVIVPTKLGSLEVRAKAFVDCTGDSDVCFFAGEDTFDNPENRRTGWYFSAGDKGNQLIGQTDPLNVFDPNQKPPEGSRYYSGTDIYDISQHMIDMRRFIVAKNEKRNETDPSEYPLIIPAFHGLRMTRRLTGTIEFSEEHHESVWFSDAIGMIGNWKKANKRYSIPYRTIKGIVNDNLYVAGRNTCADRTGWDLTRVIPSCAVTGEAAGVAAALQAMHRGEAPDVKTLQTVLTQKGVLLQPELFDNFMD